MEFAVVRHSGVNEKSFEKICEKMKNLILNLLLLLDLILYLVLSLTLYLLLSLRDKVTRMRYMSVTCNVTRNLHDYLVLLLLYF